MEELALHILDLAQNSLAAGASELEIVVNEDIASNLLTMSIKDNGRGMDKEFVNRVLDPFTTTRTTRRVGLGLPLLYMTARQCGGDLTILSTVGQGTCVTATFELNHWDLPPLGSMAATVVSLLVGRPDVDLVYRHTVGEQEFELDTKQIKAEIGPTALSEPKVLVFIRAYIEHELAKLYGGE
ncbi:MAG: ATP-binding protein [bacterium]|jgi:anti-sigma regulatory factor (Ser/Thr protein kinase)